MPIDQNKYRVRVRAQNRSEEFIKGEERADETLFLMKHQLAYLIQQEVTQRGLTQNELAKMMQISQSDVSRIMSADPSEGVLSDQEMAHRKLHGMTSPSMNLEKRSVKMLLTMLSVLGIEVTMTLKANKTA